jgi:tRNA nucleotidyltransferase/poly(A) polymerase
MPKTRQEKIADWDKEIAQIKNKQKSEKQKLAKEERAARTRRLCSRHGLLESMLPEIIDITDEQYKTFLERAVVNDYGRDKLNQIIAQGEKNSTPKSPTGAEQTADPANSIPTTATTQNNTNPNVTQANKANPHNKSTDHKPTAANQSNAKTPLANTGGGTMV